MKRKRWTKVVVVVTAILSSTADTVQAQLGSLDAHMLSIFQGRDRVMFEQKWLGGGNNNQATRQRNPQSEARGQRIIAAGQATTDVGPISTSSTVPAMLASSAAPNPSARRTYAQTYAQYLQQYSQQARASGLNPNDLADAITACVITSYSASTGQVTTSAQDTGVYRKVRSNILSNAELQGATAAEKQQLRDTLVIISVAIVKGMKGNPQEQTETRRVAEQMFAFLVGYPSDRAQLTSDGFQPR